jgi:hypothetical protein
MLCTPVQATVVLAALHDAMRGVNTQMHVPVVERGACGICRCIHKGKRVLPMLAHTVVRAHESALLIHGSTHKSTNAEFKACTHVLIGEPRGM